MKLAAAKRTTRVAQPAVQADALLCAVALDPASVPRNRHFALYAAPEMRRAHWRAHVLRRLADELVTRLEQQPQTLCATETQAGVQLVVRDERLALVRRVTLQPHEASVVRLLLGRKVQLRAGPLAPRAEDGQLVGRKLQHLRDIGLVHEGASA